MSAAKPAPIRRDWISKTLAGAVLGLAMAFVCSGLFVHFNQGIPTSPRGQLAMWMVAPISLGTLSACYFFRSGLSAWLWLGGATVLLYAVLYFVRMS